MKLLFLVLVLFVVALVGLALMKKRGLSGGAEGPWPFYAKRPLSPPEQVLYHRLVAALPEHIVLAQIQVSRVLGVKKGFKFNEWNNRINRLSYDFVVCAKDATVLAAIELDDKSHEAPSRAETDSKKDRATAAAGVRLIRWNVKSLPDQTTIQAAFAKAPLTVPSDGKANDPSALHPHAKH
jgi:very-short-patch-repair endonuclease